MVLSFKVLLFSVYSVCLYIIKSVNEDLSPLIKSPSPKLYTPPLITFDFSSMDKNDEGTTVLQFHDLILTCTYKSS